MGDRLMARACTVCDHAARDAVDRELTAGRSMRSVALKFPPLSEWAVARHRDRHLSPAIVAVASQREEGRATRLLDRVERMVGRLESAADSADETGQRKLLLDASRELRGAYELLGRRESLYLKAFASQRGLRPDVPFPDQVEPDYGGPTVERDGHPNNPYPEPHDPERDRQRERAERNRVGGEPSADAEARYAARFGGEDS